MVAPACRIHWSRGAIHWSRDGIDWARCASSGRTMPYGRPRWRRVATAGWERAIQWSRHAVREPALAARCDSWMGAGDPVGATRRVRAGAGAAAGSASWRVDGSGRSSGHDTPYGSPRWRHVATGGWERAIQWARHAACAPALALPLVAHRGGWMGAEDPVVATCRVRARVGGVL